MVGVAIAYVLGFGLMALGLARANPHVVLALLAAVGALWLAVALVSGCIILAVNR
jgi:hypothetical protein